MLRSLLLVFNALGQPPVTRQDIQSFLNTRLEVHYWMGFFHNVIVISSLVSASKMAAILREQYPLTQFFITETSQNKIDGALPQQVWDAINKPGRSGAA